MAKLRHTVAGSLKIQSIFTLYVAFTALVFGGTSNAQSVFVDDKVLETLGAPPNVASALLGKRTGEQKHYSFSAVPLPLGPKKPQFPIIIEGKFYPPAGTIGDDKKSKWDPSLTAPPDRKKRIRRNLGQKKYGSISVKRSPSKDTLEPKILTKSTSPLKSKSPLNLKKGAVSAPKPQGLWNTESRSEIANKSTVLAKAPVKTDKKPFTINFGIGTSKLNAQAQKTLGLIAGKLRASERSRVEVRAYASSSGITESQARGLSLSRALTVRASLIALGIRSTRIDVRALGSKGQTVPTDRVDLQIN